jgi:hypothetical protein
MSRTTVRCPKRTWRKSRTKRKCGYREDGLFPLSLCPKVRLRVEDLGGTGTMIFIGAKWVLQQVEKEERRCIG